MGPPEQCGRPADCRKTPDDFEYSHPAPEGERIQRMLALHQLGAQTNNQHTDWKRKECKHFERSQGCSRGGECARIQCGDDKVANDNRGFVYVVASKLAAQYNSGILSRMTADGPSLCNLPNGAEHLNRSFG